MVDAFVEELYLLALGFEGVAPEDTGRPSYQLPQGLRQRHPERVSAIRDDLPAAEAAVVSQRRSGWQQVQGGQQPGPRLHAAQLEQRMREVEESIERYLGALDTADRTQPSDLELKTARLNEKLSTLRKQMQQLREIEQKLQDQPDKQLSLTDPDARSMATSGRGTGMVGYNVQLAADTKHHLVVAHDVINVGSDRSELWSRATKAREAVGKDKLEVIADRGYFKGLEILACEEAGIKTYVPKPMTSNAKAEGRFSKADFIYIARDDEYQCPAGERLRRHHTSVENGMRIDTYWTYICPHCPLKAQCTTGNERRVRRWEHEAVLEVTQHQQRRGVGDQVGEAAVHQGREDDTGQPIQLARPDAERLRPQVQSPLHQVDEPDQGDKTERDLYRQPEVGSRLLGAGEGRVGYMKLHDRP